MGRVTRRQVTPGIVSTDSGGDCCAAWKARMFSNAVSKAAREPASSSGSGISWSGSGSGSGAGSGSGSRSGQVRSRSGSGNRPVFHCQYSSK